MPAFPLGYTLAFVVLSHAARSERATWLGFLTQAGLVGFLGILVTTLAPVVSGPLGGPGRSAARPSAAAAGVATLGLTLRSGVGLALAGLLLSSQAGVRCQELLGGGAGSSGLGWTRQPRRQPLAGARRLRCAPRRRRPAEPWEPLAVAGAATALARRDRLAFYHWQLAPPF